MTSENASLRLRQAARSTSENTQPLDDAVAVAVALRETTANLAAYIAEQAEQIAAPRIAAAEAAAAEQLADQRGRYEARLTRAADLEAELRRQLTVKLDQVARLRWIARHLSPDLRVLAGVPGPAERLPGDQPDAAFKSRVAEAAAAAESAR